MLFLGDAKGHQRKLEHNAIVSKKKKQTMVYRNVSELRPVSKILLKPNNAIKHVTIYHVYLEGKSTSPL